MVATLDRAGRATRPARGRVRAVRSPIEQRQRRVFGPFVALPLILYVGLFIAPSLYSVYASLTDWDGVNVPVWAGLRNYGQLFGDPAFLLSLKNTLYILLGVGGSMFVLSFALMLVLRDMAGRKFVRGVIFLPHIVSSIVLAIFWGFLLRYDGLVNAGLRAMGGHPISWIGPGSAFLVIMVGLVWINTGFYVTILMAGVDRIPAYFYEDSELAGASALQKLWHVTLPLCWDVIGVAAVLWTISSVKIFEFIYAFGGAQGAMPPTTEWNTAVFVFGTTVGGTTPEYRFGYASASAVVTLAMVMVLVVLLRRAMRRDAVEF